MSDTWINWRFGCHHFQIGKWFSFVRISYNEYHEKLREHEPSWKWFERY